MSYRSAPLYVQPQTVRLLRLVGKLYPARTETPVSGHSYDVQSVQTSDELADKLIRENIVVLYPLAVELAKKQDTLEKEYQDKAKDEILGS